MKLIADLGVHSPRLDQLLAIGCMHCRGPVVAGGPDYDPPLDWTLSDKAERYIENSVIATPPACNAAEIAKAKLNTSSTIMVYWLPL